MAKENSITGLEYLRHLEAEHENIMLMVFNLKKAVSQGTLKSRAAGRQGDLIHRKANTLKSKIAAIGITGNTVILDVSVSNGTHYTQYYSNMTEELARVLIGKQFQDKVEHAVITKVWVIPSGSSILNS